jgi:UDP-N-acetylglucosamine acyltransferase
MSSTIHPTAIIAGTARIGDGCEIGPYCIIDDHVELGPGCKLHHHVTLGSHTVLGQGNELFPYACLGQKSQDLKWNGGDTWLRIGDKNVFREFVTIHRATKAGEATTVGSHNLLLAYVHLAHDCQVGNHNIFSNAAMLAGHCVVEEHAIVGGMVGIHQFVRIGKHSMIGGCAAVVQDIAPYMLVNGNPAETRMINAVGLKRHGFSDEAQSALKQAYKLIFREGLTIPNALARIEAELPALPEIQHLVNFIRTSERGITK